MNAPWRQPWTLQRRLAAGALALGVIALAGDPVPGHVVQLDSQELAGIIGAKLDHVTPAELADWIVRGVQDYRLVDIREPAEYARYHIPTSENVPIAQLLEAGLARNEKIVIVSDGGVHAAQAWMLLRAEGYRGATTVLGGLDAWKDEIVFPRAPVDPDARQAANFERAVHLARFFGGEPRAMSGAGTEAPLPAIAAPATPAPAAAPARGAVRKPAAGRKPKEGC